MRFRAYQGVKSRAQLAPFEQIYPGFYSTLEEAASPPRVEPPADPYTLRKSSGEAEMIERRPFASLGHERLDWLDTHHHFSFAHYHDPERMGWGALRVWNDDEMGAGTLFPAPPHRGMEIITYVREGAIST